MVQGYIVFKKIWFNKRMHPNEPRNGRRLSTKLADARDGQ